MFIVGNLASTSGHRSAVAPSYGSCNSAVHGESNAHPPLRFLPVFRHSSSGCAQIMERASMRQRLAPFLIGCWGVLSKDSTELECRCLIGICWRQESTLACDCANLRFSSQSCRITIECIGCNATHALGDKLRHPLRACFRAG